MKRIALHQQWSRHWRVLVCLVIASCGAMACGPRVSWSERSDRQIDRAVFFKPDPVSSPPELFDLLPLIVMGQADNAEASELGGTYLALVREEKANLVTDDGVPAVYAIADEVGVGDISLSRWTFVWWSMSKSAQTPRLAAVRVTLSPLGNPIVWEALNSHEGKAGVFVANSLESAAQREFGKPKEPTTFAVSPATPQPHVEFARILADGPAPMGPMVYCDQIGNIATVACRCMPSQIGDIIGNKPYQVRVIRDLGEIDRLVFLSGDQLFRRRFDAWRHPGWTEEILRWPTEF